MVERGTGDAQLSSFVLSVMQLIGIVAGVSFSFLISMFKESCSSGQVLPWLRANCDCLVSILVGCSGREYSGWFCLQCSLDHGLQLVSERIPAKLLNQATSFAVLGCSFGALRLHSF